MKIEDHHSAERVLERFVMQQLCEICKKPVIRFEQTIARWFNEEGEDCAAHYDCKLATEINGKCPQCGSETGVKIPREGGVYCEDCGWPDEDFAV